MWDRISPKSAGPRLSLAQPWAANPKPRIYLSKRFGQPRALACSCNFNMLFDFQGKAVRAEHCQTVQAAASEEGREMPNLRMRKIRVVRLRPSRMAAPFGPPTTQSVF